MLAHSRKQLATMVGSLSSSPLPYSLSACPLMTCGFSFGSGTHTHATSAKDPSEFVSIWDLQDIYRIKVLSAKNANTPENLKVS